MEDPDIHVWMIAALLREMAGLAGQASFESVESTFSFARCIRQGSIEAPRLWLKMAMQTLGICGTRMGEGKDGCTLDCSRRMKTSSMKFYLGRQQLNHVSFKDALGTDDQGLD